MKINPTNFDKKPVITSEEIHSTSITIAKICSLWNRCVVAPLLSIFAAISNKLKTGHYLTTDLIFEFITQDGNNKVEFEHIYNIGHINSVKNKIKKLNNNENILIHVPVKSTVDHSTGMVVGRNEKGRFYGYVFDAQGNNPKKLPLKANILHISNTEDLYNELVKNLYANPLKYQNSFIQKDYISCTAYTAQWFSEVFNKSEITISNRMTEIANHNGISWLQARSHISNLDYNSYIAQ